MGHYDDIRADKQKQHYNEKKARLKAAINKMDNDELDFLDKVITNVEDYMRLHRFLKEITE